MKNVIAYFGMALMPENDNKEANDVCVGTFEVATNYKTSLHIPICKKSFASRAEFIEKITECAEGLWDHLFSQEE